MHFCRQSLPSWIRSSCRSLWWSWAVLPCPRCWRRLVGIWLQVPLQEAQKGALQAKWKLNEKITKFRVKDQKQTRRKEQGKTRALISNTNLTFPFLHPLKKLKKKNVIFPPTMSVGSAPVKFWWSYHLGRYKCKVPHSLMQRSSNTNVKSRSTYQGIDRVQMCIVYQRDFRLTGVPSMEGTSVKRIAHWCPNKRLQRQTLVSGNCLRSNMYCCQFLSTRGIPGWVEFPSRKMQVQSALQGISCVQMRFGSAVLHFATIRIFFLTVSKCKTLFKQFSTSMAGHVGDCSVLGRGDKNSHYLQAPKHPPPPHFVYSLAKSWL